MSAHERYEIDNRDILFEDVWSDTSDTESCTVCGREMATTASKCPACGSMRAVCVGTCGACFSPVCVRNRAL